MDDGDESSSHEVVNGRLSFLCDTRSKALLLLLAIVFTNRKPLGQGPDLLNAVSVHQTP